MTLIPDDVCLAFHKGNTPSGKNYLGQGANFSFSQIHSEPMPRLHREKPCTGMRAFPDIKCYLSMN
ncbi:MAG: hypothetical protein IOD05_18965 [Rhodobacter sp.]|nr:hypothetical protein [Rhodobacter sp.]